MAVTVLRKKTVSQHHLQSVQYLYNRFNATDIPQDAVQPARFYLGVLPADCLPLETYVRINSTFDKELIIGTSVASSSMAVLSTADVVFATTGTYVVDRYYGTRTTIDVALYCQTNTSGATVGQADVWQAYLPVVTVSTMA